MELPPEVKLVAVSKFHPIESIIEAYSAGQRAFAESRPQELLSKVQRLRGTACAVNGICSEETGYNDIEWHFIGHLQTNKLKMVLPYVSMIQSVDSLRLLGAIDSWAVENGRIMDVLLECHIAREEAKQGFTEEEIVSVLDNAADFHGIRFRGLMGMATFTDDKAVVRADFSGIKHLFDEISAKASGNAGIGMLQHFDQLSIGMTGDYRIAIEYGSTMVRIGTLIFGERQ